MRFLLDANLGRSVRVHLEALGHDVVRAVDRVPADSPDHAIAELANRELRHVVTCDRRFRRQIAVARVSLRTALVTLRGEPMLDAERQIRLLDRLLRECPDLTAGVQYIVTSDLVRQSNL